ncbi:hypothetical protein ACMDCT_06255 [Halomonadaceae bacterium KBTZ08]
MARYSLIFNGELDEGVDQDGCIRELARLLKQPPSTIEQNFFRRWPKTVIRTDDRAKTDNVIKAFARAGAKLELHDEQADTVSSPPRSPKPQQPPRKSPKKALAAVAILLLTVGIGGGAWYTMPLWRDAAHPALERTEAALATSDLVLLAHFDARRAIDIEQRFLGLEDTEVLPRGDDSLLSQLLESGLNPRDSLDLIVVGGYGSDDDFWGSGVALGRFNPDAIRAFVRSHYQPVSEQTVDNAILFTHVKFSCRSLLRSSVMTSSRSSWDRNTTLAV